MRCGHVVWLLCAVAMLTACDDPGEGRNFERARAEVDRAIVALARHRARTGQYPERLDALAPLELPAEYFRGSRPGRATSELHYARISADGYTLSFGYHGPGINRCNYRPNSWPSQWDCHGHY